jgi:hypothetical protein
MFNHSTRLSTILALVARAISCIAIAGGALLLAGCAWLDRNDPTEVSASQDRARLPVDSSQQMNEPFVRGHLDAYVGSPITGPRSDGLSVDAFNDLLELRFRLRRTVLSNADSRSDFRPLPSVSTFISLRTRKPIPDQSPIFGVNRITQDLLISAADSPLSSADASSAPLINARTIIAPNTTIRYRDRERDTNLTLEIHRPPAPDATSVEIVLSLAGVLPPDPDSPAGSLPIDAVETVRIASVGTTAQSLSQVDTSLTSSDPIHTRSIVVPLRLIDRPAAASRSSGASTSEAEVLIFDIEISPHLCGSNANATESSSLVDAFKSELARSSRIARVDDVGVWPGFETALRSARDPAQRRRALVWIASQTSASIAQDHLLLAADDELNVFYDLLRQDLRASTLDRKPDLLGWLMDLRSLHRLKSLASDGTLTPSLAGVLSIHTGALSRDPSSLQAILRGARSREEFETRLVAEHFIALEDSSPAIRVDAFEFLRARNQAPADYDPLASDADRARALEALEAD